MNQGVFFGQIVIGPAGSGKVFYKISKFSQHTVNTCNKWHKLYVGTSSFSTSTLLHNTISTHVMLISNN